MTLPHGFGGGVCGNYTRESCPYCNPHLRNKEIESKFYFSFRYELAKLLVYLGFVKESQNV